MTTAKPSAHDNLTEAIRGQLARVHTSLPGVVVSYDRVSQTASVQPAVNFKYRDPTDETVKTYTPQSISNAPVAWPRGGSRSITWDLEPGDEVLLVFCERSLDEWRSLAGKGHDSKDVRRFDLSDCIVIPQLSSPAAALPVEAYAAGALVVRGTDVRLGSSLATAFVALATLVDARLASIVLWANTHTHASAIGPTGPPVTPLGAQATVAATKVKAE